MSEIIQLKCPTCDTTIGSEDIHGSFIYCPHCRLHRIFADSGQLSPVFYKLYPHADKAADINLQLMNFFARSGDVDIFSNLTISEKLRRFYVPVREVKDDTHHIFVILNDADSHFLADVFKEGVIKASAIISGLNERKISDLSTESYTHEQKKCIEFLHPDVEINKVDALYGADSKKIMVVKYLPISVLGTNAGTVIAVGDGDAFTVVNAQEIIKGVKALSNKKTKKIRSIKDYFSAIMALTANCMVIFVLYKFFTTGWSFESFFDLIVKVILKVIGWTFLGIWCVIWLGLYLIGAIIFLLPIILLILLCVRLIKSNERPQAVDYKKGRKLFNLG